MAVNNKIPVKQPNINRSPNLRGPRWKKGQSGNPKGRPRNELCMTALLRKEINEEVPEKIRKKLFLPPETTWMHVQVRSLLLEAASGNSTCVKELWERLEGKVMTPNPGTGGGQIQHRIEVVRVSTRRMRPDDA